MTLFNDQNAVISSMHILVQMEDLQPHVRNDIMRTHSGVEFAQTGFTLQVVPQIVPGTNDVQMMIIPGSQLVTIDLPAGEEQQQQQNIVTLPLLFQSRVMTHVQIQDGMTVVLGQQGFMATKERMSGVPIFGDIPVLGSFFKNEQNQRDDRNLLIFLTPRIIDLRE